MKRYPYTYTVLRYVHDTMTCEFANVGVVVVAPDASFIGVHLRSTHSRLNEMFHGFNAEHFNNVIEHIRSKFDELKSSAAQPMQLEEMASNALALAHRVIPHDDSSFQWSPMGSGLTQDLDEVVKALYHRMVEPISARGEHLRRKDSTVWNTFKSALKSRNVLHRFQQLTIQGDVDILTFDHALKNGKWHGLIPTSFDLEKPRSIINKAHTILGSVTSVSDSTEEFKVYFLVSEPIHNSMMTEYETALKILDKSVIEHEIFTESQADSLADIMYSLANEHGSTH